MTTPKVLLDDILEASQRIRSYTAGLSLPDLRVDQKTIDAVVRNLVVQTKLPALTEQVAAILSAESD